MASPKTADISGLRIDRGRRNPGRGPLFWGGLLILLAAVGLGLSRLPALMTHPVSVEVAAAQADAGGTGAARSEILTANGYVVPRLKASVSSEVGGRLAALYVEEGDTARAGQVLGVLRNDDLKAQIRSGEARLESAKARRQRAAAEHDIAEQDFNRQKELLARQLIPQSVFDDAKSHLAVADAEVSASGAAEHEADADVQMLKENLEKTFIRAPFDGTVLRKEAEVGEIVSPLPANGGLTRGAIVTMADLKSSEMVVDVSEGYVTRVHDGQPAEVELDAYQGVRFPARVRQIVPTADRQKATVQVKVAFEQPDPRILPEMGGKVFFMNTPGSDGAAAGTSGAAGAVLVPDSAVQEAGGRSVVWVVGEGRAHARPVDIIGPAGSGRTRIGAGLAPGEKVIVNAPDGLKDGARVVVNAGGSS